MSGVTFSIPASSITADKFAVGAIAEVIAGASVGGVGTYAMLVNTVNETLAAGTVKAGSQLRYACADGGATTGGTPAGTWQLMGRTIASTSNTSVWLRIS